MAGTVVLLLGLLLGLTNNCGIYVVKAENVTVPAADSCTAPWNVTVDKDLNILWEGEPRDGDVRVNIEILEPNLTNCLKKTSFSSKFDEEGPPIPDIPCLNSAYRVVAELLCEGIVINNITKVVWTEPDVPSNVRSTNVTSSSFQINWDPPPGLVEEYKIKVNSAETFASDTWILMQHLESDTQYSVEVSARNKYEWGSWSKAIMVKTKKLVLTVPSNLRILDVTNVTIQVTWDRVTSDDVVDDDVFYTIQRRSLGPSPVIGVNTTNSSVTLRKLSPFTVYYIRIRARVYAVKGDWSDPLVVRTLVGIPLEPQNLSVSTYNSVKISVKWSQPTPNRGPIDFYTVKWTSLDSGTSEEANTSDTDYTIQNLTPLTSYDICISATTSAGTGNWSSEINIQTKRPSPPENVRQTAVNSSSVTIQWDEVNIYKGRGIIIGYSVRWYKLGYSSYETQNTTDLSLILDDMEPLTKYLFQVCSWTEVGSSVWTNPLLAKTALGVPLPPEKLSKGKVNTTSIEILWKVPTTYRNLVIQHTIRWQNVNNKDIKRVNTTKTSYTIKNLEPYTSYSIQVKSWTEDGAGDWSNSIIVQTSTAVPLQPKNVREEDVRNTSVLILWDEPYPIRGAIEFYLIKWQQDETSATFQNTTVDTFYFIEDLTPSRKYFIQVRAKTIAGYGNWSEPITVWTVAGLPMTPGNVKIIRYMRRSLEVVWEEPQPFRGKIISYTIQWGERGSSNVSSEYTNDTSYVIKHLLPYTWYSVAVKASTEAGDSDWSKSVEGRTAIGIPSKPRNLQDRTPATNTTIEIEWEEPKPTNGPIVNYSVRWTNLNNNVTTSSVSKDTIYVISDLKPYTNHSVKVRAATAAGFGEWTEEMIFRTDIGVPYQPKEVKELRITDTSIYLTWKEPQPLVGYVIHYIVEWTDIATNESKSEKVESLYLYHTIKSLLPYTKYLIRVSAETEAGLGEWSDAIEVQTLSGVPSAPQNIQQSKATNLTICVKWDEPTPFVGPILSYTVSWKCSVDVRNHTESANASSYCISSLQPYTVYEIGVRAETAAGFGPWSETAKIQTAIGIPAIVRNVKLQDKTAWSIHLTWQPPDPTNGPLKNYEIKWGNNGTLTTSSLTKTASFKADNLIPYTEYTFQISASTEKGFGLPSEPLTTRTSVAAPSAPLNLMLVSASNLTLSVRWKTPREPNGPILGYKVKWVKTFENVQISEFEVQSLQHVIAGLDPYTNYTIQVCARTSAGSGPWTSVLVASTKIGIPKPAELISVKSEGSRTIIVEWSTLNPYPGPTTYTLEVWRKPSLCDTSRRDVREKSIEGSRGSGEWRFSREEAVEDLTPFSDYYVRVLLKTVVDGSASANSQVVRTSPDSPGPPRQVEADCTESTETEVRWKAPLRPNGKIIEYLVRYGVEYQGWSDEALLVDNECKENHRIKLVGLRPERKYKIYVRAKAEHVEENGAEASLRGYCVLPAGIPSLENINNLKIYGSGPHNLILEWSQDVFSDSMGELVNYAIIIGVSEAVGNATSGKTADIFPSWSNYSVGSSNFYQATPLEWNPFNLDEEEEDPLQCTEIEKGRSQSQSIFRCTVGIDNECPENKFYCNGKLAPNTQYGVKIRAFTRGGFSETDPVFAYTDPIKETSSFIGIIIGVALVLVLVSVFVIGTIVLRRKGKLDELRVRLGQGPTAPSIPPEQVLQLETCATIKTLNTQNFADHVRLMMSDSHLRFSQEFEALKKNSPKFPCTAAEMEENRPKNRWLNIFPYDPSRVKLLPLGDEPGSDFVNANYIPGYSSLREYIATQGPLANTVDDFWRMIWEQSVSMIVMLTQCVERGKKKCEQYWPDAGEAKHYGDMQVRTISESMLSSYIIRLFHVQLGSQERRVKQMHFTHWPDFGCPECPDDLINFIRAVRDHLPRFKPGPIIVHCSAGVGRTGTFIAVDRLSQQLRNTDAIDIFGTVMELRHHRINMVQTEDQYIYIHCVSSSW
ncbi:phosphatidylinositol phosphatase PTPRQ [Trichonephila clavata]|uniref:protein-tyrosine-phosphatase n=1 Tax=Trichonephila clavata TaxID=2740835 RepID=A0A8X6I820_TRICU|nr:phosphatidylinositol phosphatase PTPRQ [Trichonephila clavata]